MNCDQTPTLFRRLVPVCALAIVALACLVPDACGQNRVLELDGNGSYVELPPNIFQDLHEATVEAWAKWDRFNNFSRVFEFGATWQSMSIFNHENGPDLRFNMYPRKARSSGLNFNARANGILRTNEWFHLAAVSGPGGMKLYVNGVVVATHTNEGCLDQVKAEQLNLFGRGLTRNPDDKDFCGQMDEIRVWNYRRSPDQIRENMHRRLTGREEGLVGLWNFDDGLATDSSPRGNHGKLVGNARAVTPSLPAGLQLIAAELVIPPSPAPSAAATPVPVVTAAAPVSGTLPIVFWWIAGALTLIAVLLVWLVIMLRRGSRSASMAVAPVVAAAPATVPRADGAGPDLKERALAELTDFAKQSLVQGLYSQRNALLEAQHRAQMECTELEARLAALKIPERIAAYEKRIAELERELSERTGEVRELTAATLVLLRRKLDEERELARQPGRLN